VKEGMRGQQTKRSSNKAADNGTKTRNSIVSGQSSVSKTSDNKKSIGTQDQSSMNKNLAQDM
jgi:hypothetical protein